MIEFEVEDTIARSAEEVWSFAADIGRHGSWMNVTDARLLAGRTDEPGARGLETIRMGPRRMVVEIEVSAAEPGRRLAWKIVRGAPFTADVRLELEPLGTTSTRARYSGAFQLLGLWRLLEPLLAGEVRSSGRAELGRLKAMVAAQPTPAGVTA